MNVWNFTGTLGKDAEVKATQSGTTVCDFSTAVESGYGDHKKTTWVKCVIFGKRAEGGLPPLLVKGQRVAISGEATLEEWQDQQGATQKMLKVVVGSLDLVGEKKSQPQQQAAQQQYAPQPQQAPQPPQQPPAMGQPQPDNFHDDIPF